MYTKHVQGQIMNANNPILEQVSQLLATPLAPSRYLETLNPLWSEHARGKVVDIKKEAEDAVTLIIRPNRAFPAATPGQYVQLGVDIDGVRHWRCYSLTEVPGDQGRHLSVSVRQIEGGQVSTYINRRLAVGALVHMKPAAGDFVLPASTTEPLLLISAGSGVTPMIGMLRELQRHRPEQSVVVLHFTPGYPRCLFAGELRAMRSDARRVTLSVTRGQGAQDDVSGHFSGQLLDQVCPDWQSRTAYVCGPNGLIDACVDHWQQADLSDQLKLEAFMPRRAEAKPGAGGVVTFEVSGKEVNADGETPLLDVAESAGLTPEHGCRMGICCGCLATLKEGQVQDMSSGEIHSEPGEQIRICVCSAAGDVKLEL